MTERQKRINKIKALLSKTVEHGCTEGEMKSALSLARRMMDEWEIDDTDLQFSGEGITIETIVKTDFDKIRWHLAKPVGEFCHCASWTTGGGGDTINFCGLQSETLFAHWLLDMLADFVLSQSESWLRNTYRRGMPRVRRIERGSFIVGCTERIAERLRELTPKAVPSNGRDLIVLRSQLITQHMQERGIKLREPFKLFRGNDEAYSAGLKAGDRARFNRPIDGREEQRMLRDE